MKYLIFSILFLVGCREPTKEMTVAHIGECTLESNDIPGKCAVLGTDGFLYLVPAPTTLDMSYIVCDYRNTHNCAKN